MSQATPTIGANKTGLAYRQEDNDGKAALLSQHKGSEAPAYAVAGLVWLDDGATPWLLKVYDGTDWIVIGAVNATTNVFTPYQGTAALRYQNYAADTGAADAYVIAPSPAITAYAVGQVVTLKPGNACTGASTIAVNGLPEKAIKLPDGNDTAAGNIVLTGIYMLMYNGTDFTLLNPTTVAPTSTIPAAIVAPYAGSTAPTGWLMCDGAAVSRDTYADLFAAIGETFGEGDGETTFNLPKSDGRGIIGAGKEVTNTPVLIASTTASSTDTLNFGGAHGLVTGQAFVYHENGGGALGGLTDGVTYYAIYFDADSIQVATSRANAFSNTNITTISGSPTTHTITVVDPPTRVLGETGGQREALLQGETNLMVDSGVNGYYRDSSATSFSVFDVPKSGSNTNTELGLHDNMPPFIVMNFIIKY